MKMELNPFKITEKPNYGLISDREFHDSIVEKGNYSMNNRIPSDRLDLLNEVIDRFNEVEFLDTFGLFDTWNCLPLLPKSYRIAYLAKGSIVLGTDLDKVRQMNDWFREFNQTLTANQLLEMTGKELQALPNVFNYNAKGITFRNLNHEDFIKFCIFNDYECTI